MAVDIPLFCGARSTGEIRWGRIAPRSQYVLILLAPAIAGGSGER
jgi:hypothetical protein